MITFAEAVGILTISGATDPQVKPAVEVLCREYDRMYKALDHYADLSLSSPEEAYVARVALRRQDPDLPEGDIEA